jgi:hypothetical protein
MATLKIYPRSTGMQQSLVEIERQVAAHLEQSAAAPPLRDAVGMLRVEEAQQSRGRCLADLFTARQIVKAHLDLQFINESLEAGRERLGAQGAKRIKSCGWCWTSIRLRGGLRLKLQTPYLRRSYQGRAGRRRKHRGQAGVGVYPLLAALGVEQGFSPASRSEIARQSVLCASYEEAREQLGRAGLAVGIPSIVRVAVTSGGKGIELRDKSIEAASKAPLPTDSSLAGKRVRISLDGGRTRTRTTLRGPGIRPRKNGRRPFELDWKEPRVLTVDVLDENGEMDRTFRPVYETSLAEADQVIELLVGTLRLLGVHLASEVLFVADGAPWIERRIAKALHEDVGVEPERLSLVLDYYHATERITKALEQCKHFRPEAREALREELCKLLLEPDGAQRVIERLRSLARGRRARPIQQHIRYLQQRLYLMEYAALREQDLPIGSGVVESAIRRVINLRFKSASMCWRPDHLEPLLYLRAVLKSGRWEQFFQAMLQGHHFLEAIGAFLPSPTPRRAAAACDRASA